MGISKEFAKHLEDLFSCVPGCTVRRMFGGAGIMRDGLTFAVATSEGRIALRADEENCSAFEAEGCEEWKPQMKGRKPVGMGYWYAPEFILEDENTLRDWSEEAFAAAIRADQRKSPKLRKYRPEAGGIGGW